MSQASPRGVFTSDFQNPLNVKLITDCETLDDSKVVTGFEGVDEVTATHC